MKPSASAPTCKTPRSWPTSFTSVCGNQSKTTAPEHLYWFQAPFPSLQAPLQRDQGGKSSLFLVFSPRRSGRLAEPRNLLRQAARLSPERALGMQRQHLFRDLDQPQPTRLGGADQRIPK